MIEQEEFIAITAASSVSSLGINTGEGDGRWYDLKSRLRKGSYLNEEYLVAPLDEEAEAGIIKLRNEKRIFHQLDRSVLMAMLAASKIKNKIHRVHPQRVGVNIGSSRGATSLFEKNYRQFELEGRLKTSAYSSPTTTLGNVSSWVMQYLELNGPVLSHSITCSTAMQSIMNGIAWLKAGMADKFIAGGTEAPLTPFTLAQMLSMNVYASDLDGDFPCRPLALETGKSNGMVLGEGASVFLLEKLKANELEHKNILAIIKGFGYGNEQVQSLTGISHEGEHFRQSMRMAMETSGNGRQPGLVLLHAPGTVKGDQAELNAVTGVFGKNTPSLYSNKWQIGHTLGASAALSLHLAIDILKTGKQPRFPYPAITSPDSEIHDIMINAAGFGGNAGSLMVSKP